MTGDWSPERGKEKLTPGKTALAHRLAFSFSALMRLCVSAAAPSKSSMDRMTIARRSGSISTSSLSLAPSFSTATASF
jgi:hypothetical protein